jgi:hypothetical protein
MRRIDFRKDDGVVAIIVAILFSSMVIVGILAIVIDGGSLYRERRVLQNAADSAALANAQECALETSSCSSKAFATIYTNANSPDSLSNVKEGYPCGSSTGVSTIGLASCAPIESKPFACKDIQSIYPRFVRVVSDTLTPTGSSIELPFGSALDSEYSSGKKIEACAQVAWGSANSARVAFPIAFPICAFDRTIGFVVWKPIFSSVGEGCEFRDSYNQLFTYDNNLDGFTQIANGGCPDEFNGKVYTIDGVVETVSSTRTFSDGCETLEIFKQKVNALVGKIIYVPVVGNAEGGLGTASFKIKAFYAVKFMGAKFKNPTGSGGGAVFGVPPPCKPEDECTELNYGWPKFKCGNDDACFYGQFARGLAPGSDVNTTAPAVGALAIQLVD